MKSPYTKTIQIVELARSVIFQLPSENFSLSMAIANALDAPSGCLARIVTITNIAPSVRTIDWMASVQITASIPPIKV